MPVLETLTFSIAALIRQPGQATSSVFCPAWHTLRDSNALFVLECLAPGCEDRHMTARQVMEAIRPYVDRREVPGAVVGVCRDGEVSLDAAGATALDGGTPLSVDTLMRVSSNTKPMAAALALALAEDGVLALDDPVERFVPELACHRVLRRLGAGAEGHSAGRACGHRRGSADDEARLRVRL
jgi:CubicO group peptidase (beta-lactamase class C family)